MGIKKKEIEMERVANLSHMLDSITAVLKSCIQNLKLQNARYFIHCFHYFFYFISTYAELFVKFSFKLGKLFF